MDIPEHATATMVTKQTSTCCNNEHHKSEKHRFIITLSPMNHAQKTGKGYSESHLYFSITISETVRDCKVIASSKVFHGIDFRVGHLPASPFSNAVVLRRNFM